MNERIANNATTVPETGIIGSKYDDLGIKELQDGSVLVTRNILLDEWENSINEDIQTVQEKYSGRLKLEDVITILNDYSGKARSSYTLFFSAGEGGQRDYKVEVATKSEIATRIVENDKKHWKYETYKLISYCRVLIIFSKKSDRMLDRELLQGC